MIASQPIEHEVTHQGRLHRLCSNACFVTWRKMRQLAMNCCEGCGLYCNSNSGSCQTLTLDRSQLNFCSPTCISTYKQVRWENALKSCSTAKWHAANAAGSNLLSVLCALVQTCRKVVECPNCHKMAVASSTIMERDQKGKVQLYCSTSCVEQSRPSQHALSGETLACCRKTWFFKSYMLSLIYSYLSPLPQVLHSPAASAKYWLFLSTIWPWWTAPFGTSAPITAFLHTGYSDVVLSFWWYLECLRSHSVPYNTTLTVFSLCQWWYHSRIL